MSNRPTRDEIQRIKGQVVADLTMLQTCIDRDGLEALVSVQTFVAIALEVFAGVNASRLRDAMRAVEIRSLMPTRGTTSAASAAAEPPAPSAPPAPVAR